MTKLTRTLACTIGLLFATQSPAADRAAVDAYPAFFDGPHRTLPHTHAQLDFRDNPPVTEKVEVKLLGEPGPATKAQLRVSFAKQEPLPKRIDIKLGTQTVTLTDTGQAGDEKAGDQIFTGPMLFDVPAFIKELEQRAALARKFPSVPAFHGRALIGKREVELFDPAQIKQGAVIRIPMPVGFPAIIDRDRELMVTATSVVEDPSRTFDPCSGTGSAMAPWTFGRLMQQMANQPLTGLDPAEFTRRWLRRWEVAQTVNDFNVLARPSITNTIISPWPKLPDGRLDISQAPFRLLAIVNRIDLRQNLTYGGGSAGELRFVFGAVDLNACKTNPNAGVLPFTVIFEYGVKKSSCFDLHAYAQQWHALGGLVLGSAPYNAALQTITDSVTLANADPAKPNGSALNQLRTNEIALQSPWELREFRLDPLLSGNLSQVTVKQTPDLSLNNTAVVRDYINVNQAAILNGTYQVPLEFPLGTPFLGGSSPTPFGIFWNGTPVITTLEARHLFSLGTCSGCHAGETSTVFTHVTPRPPNTPASLSNFLTGLGQPTPNPVPPPANHTFGDLERRAQDLSALVGSSCIHFIGFRPLLMTH